MNLYSFLDNFYIRRIKKKSRIAGKIFVNTLCDVMDLVYNVYHNEFGRL